jgi:hypothetical protein
MNLLSKFLGVGFLISDSIIVRVVAMASPIPTPTPKSFDVLDSTGFTPKPTNGPMLRGGTHQDLRRQGYVPPTASNEAGFWTCGWISGGEFNSLSHPREDPRLTF